LIDKFRSKVKMFNDIPKAVLGSSTEVNAHIEGIKLMVKLRGGIQNVAWNSMLLHMLCRYVLLVLHPSNNA
jgi:hypothetical protein